MPGLAQALAPYEQIMAGKDPNLLNYEGLPHPQATAPSVESLEPRVQLSLSPPPSR